MKGGDSLIESGGRHPVRGVLSFCFLSPSSIGPGCVTGSEGVGRGRVRCFLAFGLQVGCAPICLSIRWVPFLPYTVCMIYTRKGFRVNYNLTSYIRIQIYIKVHIHIISNYTNIHKYTHAYKKQYT